MGLIKAIVGATSSTFADQWKEYFYCDSLDKDTLVTKGVNRVNAKRSSNTKGSENVISNGSGIAVADGQCMIIVEQGKIVELSAEPGVYTYDKSSESSIFYGGLGKGIVDIFKTIGRRITYGGDTGKDQRVYYFNLKEIMDNKFGTANPVPFRVVDNNIGLDLDTEVKCFGTYSYRISNPLVFYKNVCGNVTEPFKRSEIDNQIKNEFVSALQPAFGRLSELEIRPNQIVSRVDDLRKAMKEALKTFWEEERGLEIVSVAIGSITIPNEDMALIKDAQRKAMYKDPSMAAANMLDAQSEALKNAASNEAGTIAGFMGLNFAQNATGINTQNAFQYLDKANEGNLKNNGNVASKDEWVCPKCHVKVVGNFCPECGSKKVVQSNGWTCKCGTLNKGKFCTECGSKKPVGEPLYRCDKCGWEPKDPKNPPRFCPECGDPFNSDDII